MKYSKFKRVARWAGNKFANKLGSHGKYWAEEYFIPHFREGFKNHSRTYIPGDITLCDVRDLPRHITVGVGYISFEAMISWSFETNDYKPADQKSADLLVFRFKAVKGQRRCTLRVTYKIKHNG